MRQLKLVSKKKKKFLAKIQLKSSNSEKQCWVYDVVFKQLLPVFFFKISTIAKLLITSFSKLLPANEVKVLGCLYEVSGSICQALSVTLCFL